MTTKDATTEKPKVAKNKKPYTIHGQDVHLDKVRLKEILDSKGLEYQQLFYKMKEEYDLDMSYKGFMSLTTNKSAWKLVYAWALAESLDVDIRDIFSKVKVDKEAKKQEKAVWNKAYGKNKGK